MATVQRLSVLVRLDDPADALRRARAEARAGDDSWQQWVDEFERGEALVIRLEVALDLGSEDPPIIEMANRGVFIEKDVHPPKVEHQVAELASKDFCALAAKLQDRGYDLDEDDLAEMYAHVELDPEVRLALRDAGASRRSARSDGGPNGDPGLSRAEDVA